jgi:hypothetical protein
MSTRRSLAESADNVREPRLETGGTPGVLLDRGKTRVLESDITSPMRRIDSAIVLSCQVTYVFAGPALIHGTATVMSPDQEWLGCPRSPRSS